MSISDAKATGDDKILVRFLKMCIDRVSSPKLQIFIVLMSHDKYMHLISDLPDAICHSNFVFI